MNRTQSLLLSNYWIFIIWVEVKYGRNWKGFDYCREFMVVIVRKEHGCASLHARALGRSRCGFIVALLYDTLIFYATFLSYFFLTIGSWRGTGCHGLGHLHSHVQVGLILSRTIKMDTCNWSNKSVHKRKERILLPGIIKNLQKLHPFFTLSKNVQVSDRQTCWPADAQGHR